MLTRPKGQRGKTRQTGAVFTYARKAESAGEGNCVCAGLRVWSADGVRNKPGTGNCCAKDYPRNSGDGFNSRPANGADLLKRGDRDRGRLYAGRGLRITRATVRKMMAGDRPARPH
jgi:hypothetical protein